MWIFVSKMCNRWNIRGLLFIIYGISFTQSIKITWGKKPTSNIFSAKSFLPAASSFSGTPNEPAAPDTTVKAQVKQTPAPPLVPYPASPSLQSVTFPTEPPSKFEGSGIVVSNPVIMREERPQNNQGRISQQRNGRQRKNNRNRRPDFNQNNQQFSDRRQNQTRRRKQQNSNRRDFQQDPIDSRPGNNFNNRQRNRQNNQQPPFQRYNNQQGQSDRFGNQQPTDRFNDRQGQRDGFNNNQVSRNRANNQQSPQRNSYDNPPFDNRPQQRDRLNQGPVNNNQRRDRGRQGGQYNVDQGPYSQSQYDVTQPPLFDPPTTLPPLQDMGGPATPPIRDPPYQPLGRQQQGNRPQQVRLQRPPPMSQAMQPVSQRKPGPRNSQNNLQTPTYSFKQQQDRMNRFNERAPPRPQDQYNNMQGSGPVQGQTFNQGNGPMGYPTATPPSAMAHTTQGFNQFSQPMRQQMNGPQQPRQGPNQFPPNNVNHLPGQPPMAPAPGGHGPPCDNTADCNFGCCYDNKGHLLDMDTYGPRKMMKGKVKGMCLRRSPGLGQQCDDLCTCQKGLDCYRRYPPDYKMGSRMAQNPHFQPPDNGHRPQRKCVRRGVMLAEQWAFWKCYFDTACSGPLPNQ